MQGIYNHKAPNFHQELVGGIDLHGKSGRVTRGRDCLRVFYFNRLLKRFDPRITKLDRKVMTTERVLKECRDAYGLFWRKNYVELAHYFRTLYRIFKFIDETTAFEGESAEIEKKRYSGLVRAQLSNPELALIFYNCLTTNGQKFKPLVERYSILENMTLDDLYDAGVHVPLFARSAYGTHELAPYFFDSV